MINNPSHIQSQLLIYELNAAAATLKKQWQAVQSRYEIILLQVDENPALKIWIVQNVAQGLVFLRESHKWEKTCDGHKMRYNSHHVQEHEGNQIIEKMTEIFLNDPTIKKNSVYGEKTKIKKSNGKESKRKWDVRMGFKHHPNVPACNSKDCLISCYQWIKVESILDKLDQFIFLKAPHQFHQKKFEFYSTLFSEMIA